MNLHHHERKRAMPDRRAWLATACALLLGCSGGSDGSGGSGESSDREAAAAGTRAWHHPLGATLAVPEDWETMATAGSSAFLPPGVRNAAGELIEVASFVYLPAAGIASIDQEALVATADREVASMAASARRLGAGETVKLADRAGLVLRYETAESGIPGRVDLYATLHDGLAIGLLVVGQRDRVAADVEAMGALFQTLRLGAAQRDTSLVSTWTRGESYVSSGFSIATESRLVLGGDGRYSRSSQAAGGDAGSSFDSNGDDEAGQWCAADGALVLLGDAGVVTAWTYRLVDGTLVLHDASGNRTLWQ